MKFSLSYRLFLLVLWRLESAEILIEAWINNRVLCTASHNRKPQSENRKYISTFFLFKKTLISKTESHIDGRRRRYFLSPHCLVFWFSISRDFSFVFNILFSFYCKCAELFCFISTIKMQILKTRSKQSNSNKKRTHVCTPLRNHNLRAHDKLLPWQKHTQHMKYRDIVGGQKNGGKRRVMFAEKRTKRFAKRQNIT